MDQLTFNAALAVYASNLAAMAPHLFHHFNGFSPSSIMKNFVPAAPIIVDCRRQMIEEDLLKKFQNQVYMRQMEENIGRMESTNHNNNMEKASSQSPLNIHQQNLVTLAEVASTLKRETTSAVQSWETLLAAAELQHKKRASRKRRNTETTNDKIDDTINHVIRWGTPCTSAAAVDLSIKKRRPVEACRRQTFLHSSSSQQGLTGRVIYTTPDDRRLTNMDDVAKFLKEKKSSELSINKFNFDPRAIAGEYFFVADDGTAQKFTAEDMRLIIASWYKS